MYHRADMGKSRTTAQKNRSQGPDATTRICVIYGAEAMIKRQQLDQLRDALRIEHGQIETIVFDGVSAELADVLDELRSYGLMQQYKVVIVDDADQFVTNYRQALERYAASPVDNATLVLRGGKWNKGKLDKAIEKVGCVIKCEALSQPKAAQWLVLRAKTEHSRELDQATAMTLVRRLGSDLTRLDTEVAKLAVLTGAGERIDAGLIDDVVGHGSDEAAWEVQEAFLEAACSPGAGSPGGRVIEKLHELIDLSTQPEVLVAYFVADLMRKLYLALMMKRQGMPEGQIGRALKIWPAERQALFMSLLRRLNEDAAGRLFDQIIELDGRGKSGRGSPTRNLERFCAALADEIC